MTARQKDEFRRFLEAKAVELKSRVEHMRGRLAIGERGDSLDRVRSINERESAVCGIAFEVRLLERVQNALREIGAGMFGRCAACNREIPLRRLKAVPWSPYCLECQQSAEAGNERLAPAGETYYARAV